MKRSKCEFKGFCGNKHKGYCLIYPKFSCSEQEKTKPIKISKFCAFGDRG